MKDITVGTVFEGLTFNVQRFATFPKCKGSFLKLDEQGNKFGCLITAFSAAFGFIPSMIFNNGHEFVVFHNYQFNLSPNDMACAVNILLRRVGYGNASVINTYDKGDASEALSFMWKIIEELPNKVNGAVTKDEVVMPAEKVATC